MENVLEALETTITKLINSDISGYRLHKDFPNIQENLITRLRNGNHKLDNLPFQTIKKLYKAHLYYTKQGLI